MPESQVIATTTNYRKKHFGKAGAIHATLVLPETAEEAIEMYGEAVVLGAIRKSVVIDFQADKRRRLGEDYPDINVGPGQVVTVVDDDGNETETQSYTTKMEPDEVVEAVASWKPSPPRGRKSEDERRAEEFDKMSREEQEATLAKLQARLKS